MFDLGWGKIVIIAVIALVVIAPKELPAVLRTVGQWMGKIRRMAGEFQSQFQEAMREAEMADLKKSVDELSDAAKGITADPFDFSESTKWEPKSDISKSDTSNAETAAAAGGAAPAEAAPATPTELGGPAAADPSPASWSGAGR